jgi:seryl-tRNA synthetase
VATPAAEPTVDWQKVLDTVDPKELRRHPKIAGLVGSQLEAERRREQQEREAAAQAKARQELDAEFEKLAAENEETLQERYPSVYRHVQRLKTEREEGESLKKFAARVGQAYNNLPEWKEATADERQELAKALIGVPDEDVVAVANSHILKFVAGKQNERTYAERLRADLARERKAWETEAAARGFKASDAPDMARGQATPARVDVNALPKAEFDQRWERFKATGKWS